MSYKGLFLVCALALTVGAGCKNSGKDSKSKNSDGSCNSSFIRDYNQIVNVGSVSSSSSESRIQAANRHCDDFFSKHSGVSCKASQFGVNTTAKASDHKSYCATVDRIAAEKRSTTPAPRPSPRPSPRDNACTQGYLSSYNGLTRDMVSLGTSVSSTWKTTAQKLSEARRVKRSCESFNRSYGNITCKAQVNGQRKDVSARDFDDRCDSVDDIISQLTAPAPAPDTYVSQEGDETLMTDLEGSNLQFLVKDQEKLNEVLHEASLESGDKALMDGNIVSYEPGASLTASLQSKLLCWVNYVESQRESAEKFVSNRDVQIGNLVPFQMRNAWVKIRVGLEDYSNEVSLVDAADLICMSRMSLHEMTLGDLRRALQGVVEISLPSEVEQEN